MTHSLVYANPPPPAQLALTSSVTPRVGSFAASSITRGPSFLKKSTFGHKAKNYNPLTEEINQETLAPISTASNRGAAKGSSEGGVAAYDPNGNQVALGGSEDYSDPELRARGKRAGLSHALSMAGIRHKGNRCISSTLSVDGVWRS